MDSLSLERLGNMKSPTPEELKQAYKLGQELRDVPIYHVVELATLYYPDDLSLRSKFMAGSRS